MTIKVDLELVQNKLLEYKSITEIAKELGINRSTLSLKIKNNNLIKPSKFNDSFFENINTENKAYWLGFLMADGNVCDTQSTLILSVGLQLNDANHLEKFNKDIESVFKVRKYKHSCAISFNSNKLCNDLIKHGCVPRKSKILKYPNIELHSHFIRGYFDGDGSIYFNKKTKNWKLQIAGTENILSNFQQYFSTNVKLQHKDNIYLLTLHGNKQVKRILQYLYDDSNIFLDRKYSLYKECCYS